MIIPKGPQVQSLRAFLVFLSRIAVFRPRLSRSSARDEFCWSWLPLEGLYVRNGFGLGDFRFVVVQVEQAIFPVAHSQLVHI